MAEVSWENSKPSRRYQNFLSREEVVHVHCSPIYGRSVKWRKTINEMGGNIPGGNFLGANFPGGNFPRILICKLFFQKHSPRSVLWKTCSKRFHKIYKNCLCRIRFFIKVDYVTIYFYFWFYKLFLLMEPFASVPQSSCSAKFCKSHLKTPVTESCTLKLCNNFFRFFIEYLRVNGIYWCIGFNDVLPVFSKRLQQFSITLWHMNLCSPA